MRRRAAAQVGTALNDSLCLLGSMDMLNFTTLNVSARVLEFGVDSAGEPAEWIESEFDGLIDLLVQQALDSYPDLVTETVAGLARVAAGALNEFIESARAAAAKRPCVPAPVPSTPSFLAWNDSSCVPARSVSGRPADARAQPNSPRGPADQRPCGPSGPQWHSALRAAGPLRERGPVLLSVSGGGRQLRIPRSRRAARPAGSRGR
jgi:hypothetical protein